MGAFVLLENHPERRISNGSAVCGVAAVAGREILCATAPGLVREQR